MSTGELSGRAACRQLKRRVAAIPWEGEWRRGRPAAAHRLLLARVQDEQPLHPPQQPNHLAALALALAPPRRSTLANLARLGRLGRPPLPHRNLIAVQRPVECPSAKERHRRGLPDAARHERILRVAVCHLQTPLCQLAALEALRQPCLGQVGRVRRPAQLRRAGV